MQITPTLANRLALAAAGVTVILWASVFVGVRSVIDDFSPGALGFARQFVASATLTIMVAARSVHHRKMPTIPSGRMLVGVLVWGAFWFGVYTLTLNMTEVHLDAGTTSMLVNVAPILIAVLAAVFLGERLTARLAIGVLVAFAGVAVIALTSGGAHGSAIGVMLGLATAVVYAASAVAQKRILKHVDALTLTWLGSMAGTVVTAPFAGSLPSDLAQAPSEAVWTVLYMGSIATAVALLCWGYALSKMSAGRLASSTYLVPPLVIVFSWLLLGEAPTGFALLGGALCLVGVAIGTGMLRGVTRRGHAASRPPSSPESALKQLSADHR